MGGLFLLVAGGLIGYHVGKKHADDCGRFTSSWTNNNASAGGAPWSRENRWRREQARQAGQQQQPEVQPQPTQAGFMTGQGNAPADQEKYDVWKRQAAESVLDTAERSLGAALEQVASFRRQYGVGNEMPSTPPLLPRQPSSGNLREL